VASGLFEIRQFKGSLARVLLQWLPIVRKISGATRRVGYSVITSASELLL
jgi:hypothetical protein